MVEDRITDGRRIAQLLASELTGLGRGPLSAVSVVDADRDAEPAPDGTTAYAIDHSGERVGTVDIHETGAVLAVTVGAERAVAAAEESGLGCERTAEGVAITVDHGAAVKRAVDVLAAALREVGEDTR